MKKFLLTFACSAALIFGFKFLIPHAHAQGPDVLTLNEAMSHVYQTNPTLLAAREELEENRELYPQAKAGWLPTLGAESSIFATDIENSNFGNGDGATTKDFSVTLDQPIFRGGRTFAETSQARNLIKAAEYILLQEEQGTYLRTAIVYMDLLRDAHIYTLRQENENILQQELTAAQERHNYGEATITDVHQAEVRFQRARADRIAAQGNLDESEAAFIEVVGHLPPSVVKPELDFTLPTEIEEMVFMAENQNPEIWIAKYQHAAAKDNVDAIMRELFPQISGFASYNKQYDPQPGIISSSETQTIGLRATLALYQGGATRSRIRESKRAAKRQEYTIEEIQRRVRRDITSNWNNYAASRAETYSRMAEIEAAEMALEGVREESRLGQRTTLDILDADKDVIDARVSLAQAIRNEVVAGYTLAARLGMLQSAQGSDQDERSAATE